MCDLAFYVEMVRDIILVFGAPAGLWLALRRCRTADQNFELLEQNSRRDRFKVGMELLGNESHAVRRGAVAVLCGLAHNHAREFYLDILAAFVALLTHPPRYHESHPKHPEHDFGSEDLIGIMEFINGRTTEQKDLERAAGFDLERRLRTSTTFRLVDDQVVMQMNVEIDPDNPEHIETSPAYEPD